jgi:predicted RNA-binding protein associated with RNAse of E/G family
VVGSVVKYWFYMEWFSNFLMVRMDGETLGYYLDLHTLLRKVDSEDTLTDLLLDLGVTPDGCYFELDRKEFEPGFRKGLISSYQYKENQVFEK